MSEAEFHRVASASEIPEGEYQCMKVEDRSVMVIHCVGDVWRAIENQCSHDARSFDGARIRGSKKIVCPHHGANFDLETGKALNPPAVRPITIFPVKVEGDDVLVQLVEAEQAPKDPFRIPGVRGF